MSWTGKVEVKIDLQYVFEIDEDWEAEDEADARRMVDDEIGDYLGGLDVHDDDIIITMKPDRNHDGSSKGQT